jgi:hypothetical protein
MLGNFNQLTNLTQRKTDVFVVVNVMRFCCVAYWGRHGVARRSAAYSQQQISHACGRHGLERRGFFCLRGTGAAGSGAVHDSAEGEGKTMFDFLRGKATSKSLEVVRIPRKEFGAFMGGAITAWWMALVFVIHGLTAVAFLAINVPPFQIPDEPTHFMRAAQIADGTLIGTRLSENGADGLPRIKAGGPLDPGIQSSFNAFSRLPFHPDQRASRADWEPDIHWSEKRVFSDFPNTALYPPILYLPSVLGVLAGQKARLSVVQTLVLSRLLTGVTAVALAAVAIAAAGGAATWLFTILALPMSVSLMASASQDALLIACSALAAALVFRVLRSPNSWNRISLAGVVATLSLAGMARPPYAALAVLPLGLVKMPLRWRIVAAALIVLCVITWSLLVMASTWTNYSSALTGADVARQLEMLRGNPLFVGHVMAATLREHWQGYLASFVGVLGWLDTPLPTSYYAVALCMLAIAALTAMLGTEPHQVAPAT